MTATWGKVPFGGTVYALSFNNGIVKIGKTTHLRQRFNRHLSWVRRCHNARLSDWYFTSVHDTYSATEDFATQAAESLMTAESARWDNEIFINIDFGCLLGLLAELDPTSTYNRAPEWAVK